MGKEFISNRYRVIDTLGEGGMGIVYLVEDTLKGNMRFALKTIRQNVLSRFRSMGIESFKNEYEIMTRLRHPNLTQVYEFGEDGENYYIVMEYLHGLLITDLLKKYGRHGIREGTDIVVQILRALEYIHSRNIIYRDIKPGNIMLIGDHVKLLDFGLAGFEKKKEKKVRGTLQYFSPDAVRKDIGFTMDIFSLGIVFYELVTGRMYFDSTIDSFTSIIDLLENRNNYSEFHEERIGLIGHEGIRKIIRKMTEYDVRDRYKTCSEVISDLNKCFDNAFEFETAETIESYVLGNAFANRKEEFSILKRQLNNGKTTHLFVYNGNVGVGKTRLFSEFKKYCRLNDMLFFDTSCAEGEIREYHYFGEIVLQMIIYSSEVLLNRYGPYLKLIVPESERLEQFGKVDIADNPMTLKDITIQNIIDYMIEFYKDIGGNYIIYFNDLQWIDDGSAVMLETLLNRLNVHSAINIVIYANINEDRIRSGTLRAMLDNAGVVVHELGALDKEGVEEYIDNIFGPRFIDTSIRDSVSYIRDRVGGNPLFLEELMKSLMEKSIIVKDGSYWRLQKPVDDIEIPRNLIDTVKERTDKLLGNNVFRSILHKLALLRIDLSIDHLLYLIEDIGDIESAESLFMLERMEILKSHGLNSSMYYSFSTSLIKDIIRDGIDDSVNLHLVLAKKLEALLMDTGEFIEEITYHYIEGKDNDKAVFYCRKSAEYAKDKYFHDKAVKYYDILLRQLDVRTLDERLDIMLDKARSLDTLGNWSEALDVLNECRTSAELNERKIVIARIHNLSGRIYLKRGEHDRAKESFDKLLHIAEETGNIGLFSTAFDNLGNYYYHKAEYKKAMEYHAKNRDICIGSGDKKGYLMALNNIGNIHFVRSRFNEAINCFNKSQLIALELGDKKSVGDAVCNQGNVYYSLGDYKKALECYDIDLKISEEIGDKRSIGIAKGNLGNVYFSLADYEKALSCYESYRKISLELGDKKGLGTATGNLGNIYYFQGKYTRAMQSFKEFKRIAEEIGDKQGTVNAALNIGNIYYYQGRDKKALKYYTISANIARESGDRKIMAIAYNNMGNIYRNQKMYKESLRLFEEGRRIFEEIGDKTAVAVTDLNLGNIYSETGEFQKALDLINNSRLVFTDINDSHGIANSYGILGNVYYRSGKYEKALVNFDESIGLFSELGVRDPDLVDYIINRSHILLDSGRIKEAEDGNRKAMKMAKELNNLSYIKRATAQKEEIEGKLI